MKGSEIIKETLHKADGVLYPVDGRKDKVVIVLSGSEGGLEHAEKLAKYLQIEGCSKGAEYAAAAAIAFHELSCVILKIPSWFYSEGMNGTKPSGTSCWSYKGKEIPYTPYKTRKLPVIKEMIKNREYNILAINTGKKINPDSIIPIEKIQAPILMFSTEVDTIWPSRESCEKLEECARERVIMGQECIKWIEEVW